MLYSGAKGTMTPNNRVLSPAANVGVEGGRRGYFQFPAIKMPLHVHVGIVSQRAERAARILRIEVEPRSSGAARL